MSPSVFPKTQTRESRRGGGQPPMRSEPSETSLRLSQHLFPLMSKSSFSTCVLFICFLIFFFFPFFLLAAIQSSRLLHRALNLPTSTGKVGPALAVGASPCRCGPEADLHVNSRLANRTQDHTHNWQLAGEHQILLTIFNKQPRKEK